MHITNFIGYICFLLVNLRYVSSQIYIADSLAVSRTLDVYLAANVNVTKQYSNDVGNSKLIC